MSEINFNQVLKNIIDGEDMTENVRRANGKVETIPFTLLRACLTALGGTAANEPPASANDQLQRFLLAEKINGIGPVELSADEIVLIKERLAKAYTAAAVVGQAIKLVDPGAAAALKKS